MASTRFEAEQRGIWFPSRDAAPVVRVHWNGRHGAVATLEVAGDRADSSTETTRIALGDFLRGLGLTSDDCAAALAEAPTDG